MASQWGHEHVLTILQIVSFTQNNQKIIKKKKKASELEPELDSEIPLRFSLTEPATWFPQVSANCSVQWAY